MATETLLELQSQRDLLKGNLQDVNKNIQKLTGRNPEENRRLSTNQRRFQLKRTSIGSSSNNQPPEKRAMPERRRWGNTVVANKSKRSGSGDEDGEEEKRPAVHSSVVATGKPIEVPQRPKVEDKAVVNRNKRMLGVLMGTLRQFKRESQYKSEQESKREEKLSKVEEQVEKDKENAQIEKKELYQTRRTKQDELKKLEFKIDMAELSVELKKHYEHFKDCIQLKSTPRVFYRPAKHNSKTLKMLEESQKLIKESLEQRLKEIEMFTEEDILAPKAQSLENRRTSRLSKDVIVIEPAQTKRDLFEEDKDNDIREREADSRSKRRSSHTSKSGDVEGPDDNNDGDDDDVVEVKKDSNKSDSADSRILNGNLHKVDDREEEVDGIDESTSIDDNMQTNVVVNTGISQDSRRVVSDVSAAVVDERVVEFSGDLENDHSGKIGDDEIENEGGDDDINIYEDMPQDIEFQAEA